MHIWVKATKEKSELRKRQGLEAAVDEVMDKIREMAKKKKNFWERTTQVLILTLKILSKTTWIVYIMSLLQLLSLHYKIKVCF